MRERNGARDHRRGGLLAILITGLVAVAVPPPGAAGTSAAPVQVASAALGPAVSTTPVPSASGASLSRSFSSGGPTVARLPRSGTDPFDLVAVTWPRGTVPHRLLGPENFRVEVSVRVDGSWSRWQRLHVEPAEGPAADEESDVREGTAPMWVGGADGVAVRAESVTGQPIEGLDVVTVDASATTGASASAASAGGPASRRPASGDRIVRSPLFPVMPRIISRRAWGADESMGDPCWAPRYGSNAKMVFIHHTAGSNGYTVRESPAIVRSILAYHTQARGWCDIGYNYLVDRFGNIYEGRDGGVRRPVRGAHAGDYNTNTAGISLMGNFEKVKPSRRMMNALVRLTGWRLGTSYVPPRGFVRVAGDRFRRISGHRDAMSTSCPGRYVYKRLPRIRNRVASYLRRYDSPIERRAARLTREVVGSPFIGEQKTAGGRRTVFGKGSMYYHRGFGTRWLKGRTLARFNRTGGPEGPLGWPTTRQRNTQVQGAKVTRFEHGAIYAIRHTSAKALYGRIYRKYRRLGLAQSRLGLPETGIERVRAGTRAEFRNGVIRRDRSSGRIEVRYE